jgi:hypothetical protein
MTKVVCSVCRKRIAGRVPSGGDGSIWYPRRHKSMLDGYTNPCPGTYELTEEIYEETQVKVEPTRTKTVNMKIEVPVGDYCWKEGIACQYHHWWNYTCAMGFVIPAKNNTSWTTKKPIECKKLTEAKK